MIPTAQIWSTLSYNKHVRVHIQTTKELDFQHHFFLQLKMIAEKIIHPNFVPIHFVLNIFSNWVDRVNKILYLCTEVVLSKFHLNIQHLSPQRGHNSRCIHNVLSHHFDI